MKYATARHYVVGAEMYSVLMQHYEYKGEQICFAGIAEGNDVTEQLHQWFWTEIMEIFLKRHVNFMKSAERSLRRVLKGLPSSVSEDGREEVSFALLLCKGAEFLAFEQGEMCVVCFNTAFGKSHLSYLQEGGGQDICCGSVEADVAFLLTSSQLCEGIGIHILQEVLFVGETRQEWQMEKRLGELLRESIREDMTVGGALLVRSCSETAENVQEYGVERGGSEDVSEMEPPLEVEDVLQHDFMQVAVLGEGAFSQVIKVQECFSGKIYACKKSRNIFMLWREYCVGKVLEHPIFPKMYHFWQDGEWGYLLMEFVPGADMKNMLERRTHFTVNQTIRIGMELAEGLLYLHEQAGFLFRDVKPENIVIRQDGRVKLLDLGCACRRDILSKSRAGSPGFAAPEQFEEGKGVDVTCDIYGLGRTMVEMLGRNIGKCKGLRSILENCLEEDPRKRIPDMRLLLNLLGALSRKKKGHMAYKRGILCYKNIWERSAETS